MIVQTVDGLRGDRRKASSLVRPVAAIATTAVMDWATRNAWRRKRELYPAEQLGAPGIGNRLLVSTTHSQRGRGFVEGFGPETRGRADTDPGTFVLFLQLT
jgi:hypothetical protein